MPYTQPWIITFWPRFQADCMMVEWPRLYTCSMTLISHSMSKRCSGGTSPSSELCLYHRSRMCSSQLSINPSSGFSTAACTPPQPRWPQMMMCSTSSTSTAYCTTDRQLRSVWITRFATLRWTNSSPGSRPVRRSAGTRLSEQPIHKKRGFCAWAKRSKNSGSS